MNHWPPTARSAADILLRDYLSQPHPANRGEERIEVLLNVRPHFASHTRKRGTSNAVKDTGIKERLHLIETGRHAVVIATEGRLSLALEDQPLFERELLQPSADVSRFWDGKRYVVLSDE